MREAGLSAPPTGRLWLVRSPWPRLPVSAIYELIWEHAERRRGSEAAVRDPGELHRWLQAGFDLYAADKLQLAGLEAALRRREASFDEKGHLRAAP